MRKPEKKDYLVGLSVIFFIFLVFPVAVMKNMIFSYFSFFDKWSEISLRIVKKTIVSRVPQFKTDSVDRNIPEFKVITIKLKINSAENVFILGDFTKWKAQSMNKINNEWVYSVPLIKGNYRYVFVVDGKEILDPLNPSYDYYDNRKVSVISVK